MTGDAGGDMLSWDESVFRDESVFEIDHVPETFRHRESQLESLKYALRPAVRGSRPLNTIVRGPPGTGKTTAVQKLFGELSARTDVRTVRVNCQVDSTRYAVFSRLFEGIFDYEPPSSGISFKKLFGQITDRPARRGGRRARRRLGRRELPLLRERGVRHPLLAVTRPRGALGRERSASSSSPPIWAST